MQRVFSHFMKRVSCLNSFTSVSYAKDVYTFDNEGNVTGTVKGREELYQDLKDRIDLTMTSYVPCESFEKLLPLLFFEEDIPLITHVYTGAIAIDELAERVGLSYDETWKRVDDLCHRGILVDFEVNDKKFVMLPEYVVGWFEFSGHFFLNFGEEHYKEQCDLRNIDGFELMKIYEEYTDMYTPNFVYRDVHTLRTVPHDIQDDEPAASSYILDFETALGVLENSDRVAIMDCVCKNHEEAMGHMVPDDIPKKCCLALNRIHTKVRVGVATEISIDEAKEMITELSKKGHLHLVENVHKPAYMCQCHVDYCGVLNRRERLGLEKTKAMMTSQFLPVTDHDACIGCGKCVDLCAWGVREYVGEGKEKTTELIEGTEEVCLGCMICKNVCPVDAITTIRRAEPVPVCEDIFDLKVRQAFELNKLNTIIFNDPMKVSHKILRSVCRFIEGNPVSEKVKNIEAVKSRFLNTFAQKVREGFYDYVGFVPEDVEEDVQSM